MDEYRPSKKPKLNDDIAADPAEAIRMRRTAFLDSLTRPVSPPSGQSSASASSRGERPAQVKSLSNSGTELVSENVIVTDRKRNEQTCKSSRFGKIDSKILSDSVPRCVPSPVQLSHIVGLPASENVDAVSLRDILGDPLIKEAWIFNFCFDVDWLMQYFDEDVRETVQVKIVHGSWKREDPRKIDIDEACSRRPNVSAIQAYLPDAFGTHHSKMFVLLRHDDLAQVIIHTANMLSKDWTNMTQAVWRSPLLPVLKSSARSDSCIDTGNQFKHDLVRYLKAYGSKLKPLIQQLQTYDFKHVRAAIVASVPSKFKISAADDEVWGHEMLRRQLAKIELDSEPTHSASHFCFQVSSIASLPSTWLENTLYQACGTTKSSTSVIYPTAPDVAKSLDGYAAGGSIHTKAQTPVHLKQISTMRLQLCRWTQGPVAALRAGRNLAAPHIKTYIRFASKPLKDKPVPNIDWALVTSANLSTQAWGSAPKLAKGEKDPREATVHIQSYEIGVLVWPGLYRNGDVDPKDSAEQSAARMVPVFGNDTPAASGSRNEVAIGFRMPYDLPLTPYKADELPWSPQSSYNAPDRHGVKWQ